MRKLVLAMTVLAVLPATATAQRNAPTAGDGALNRDAYLTAAQTRFDAIDTNTDDEISQDEYVTVRLAEFDAADRNTDGMLTRGELRNLTSANGQRSLDRDQFEAGVMRRYAELTANGPMTEEAYLSAAAAAFDAADRNGDGALDRGEARGLQTL